MNRIGIGLEHRQTLKVEQRLVITPQLQQAIKLLQLNNLELEQALLEELLENPLLEESIDSLDNTEDPDAEPKQEVEEEEEEVLAPSTNEKEAEQTSEATKESQEIAKESSLAEEAILEEEPTEEITPENEIDWEAYFEDMDSLKGILPSNKEGFDPDEPTMEARLTKTESLADHLISQLRLMKLTQDEFRMAILIIGSLDDNGWLILDPESDDEDFFSDFNGLTLEDYIPQQLTKTLDTTDAKNLEEASLDEAQKEAPELLKEEQEAPSKSIDPYTDPLDYMTILMLQQLDEDPEQPSFLEISEEERLARFSYWREVAEKALAAVQELEPAGVGARSLKESLLLQVRQLSDLEDPDLIERLIKDHLDALQKKHYSAIAKKIHIALEELVEALKIIKQMVPYPGRKFVEKPSPNIRPDIHLRKVGNEYEIILNQDGLSKLKLNESYKKMLSSKGKEFVQEKMKNATWFLRSLFQRQKTIRKVVESIVQRQRDFLDKGIQYLKPMVLKDVAEDIGMHESTVSRVTTNKYIETPQGLYELKFFFSSGLQSTRGGEDISSLSVKNLIQQMIEEENPKNPLSDQQIVANLKREGISIARRTVAKYRNQLNIPSSPQRKKRY